MGQSLDSMSQNQSKEELLYQLLNSGNVEAIKALCREGANLEVYTKPYSLLQIWLPHDLY